MTTPVPRGRSGLAGLCALVLLFCASEAQAKKRVVVLDFDGARSRAVSEQVRTLVGKKNRLVSAKKYRRTAKRMRARRMASRHVAKVAGRLDADAVIHGALVKKRGRVLLRLRIRSGKNGELVKKYAVTLEGRHRTMSRKVRKRLARKISKALRRIARAPKASRAQARGSKSQLERRRRADRKRHRTARLERKKRKRAKAERAEHQRAKAERAERKQAERKQAERKRAKAERAERKRAKAERMERKRAKAERAERKRAKAKRQVRERERAKREQREARERKAERARKRKRAEDKRNRDRFRERTDDSGNVVDDEIPTALKRR